MIDSSYASYGSWARLRGKLLSPTDHAILTFSYYMNGASVNALKVYAVVNGFKHLLLAIHGNQGDLWHTKHLTVSSLYPYRVSLIFSPSSKHSQTLFDITILFRKLSKSFQRNAGKLKANCRGKNSLWDAQTSYSKKSHIWRNSQKGLKIINDAKWCTGFWKFQGYVLKLCSRFCGMRRACCEASRNRQIAGKSLKKSYAPNVFSYKKAVFKKRHFDESLMAKFNVRERDIYSKYEDYRRSWDIIRLLFCHQVMFEALAGIDYRADIAIDDISLHYENGMHTSWSKCGYMM